MTSRRPHPSISLLVLLSCAVVVALPARSGQPAATKFDAPSGSVRLTGFAAPARKATLAATQDGRIAEQLVREGARVNAGQTLLRLDDRVQRARTEVARIAAESLAEIALAAVRAEFAQAEVDHVRQLGKTDLASAREMRVADSNAATTTLEIAQVEAQQRESERNLRLQELLLEEHEIRAPFDGFISETMKELGEVVEAREGVITLVQLDPLEVTLDCPVTAWSDCLAGEVVRVAASDGSSPPREGVITFANRVADAASQTFKLKVRVANPNQDWIAGLRVQVDLPPGRLPPATEPTISNAATGSEVLP